MKQFIVRDTKGLFSDWNFDGYAINGEELNSRYAQARILADIANLKPVTIYQNGTVNGVDGGHSVDIATDAQRFTDSEFEWEYGNVSKDRDNILVDMYNLALTENPDKINGINPDSKDEVMILDFFKKYDPKVANYVTDFVFNYTNPRIDGYEKRTFKQIKGKPYFQSDQIIYFYELWNLVRKLIDSHRQHTKSPTRELERVIGLLEDIKHSLLLTDRDGHKIIVRENYAYNTNIPNEIDLSQYSVQHYLDDFGEYIFGGTEIYLTLGKLKYRFYNAILEMWNNETNFGECQLEGCTNIFIIKRGGHTQKYCSDAHKAKGYRQRKNKLIVV